MLICHICLFLAGLLEPDLDVTLYSLYLLQPIFTCTIHEHSYTGIEFIFTLLSQTSYVGLRFALNPYCILFYGS